ncbi:MAG: class I SAM-dependent methyltransferase [Nanoarchaeota archaeon]
MNVGLFVNFFCKHINSMPKKTFRSFKRLKRLDFAPVNETKYGMAYTLITRTTGFLSRTVLYYRRTELNYICNQLKTKNNLRILDYGCNTGYLLNIINKKYPRKNFELCGADINPYALDYARNNYNEATFFDINKDNLEGEKFDMIILSHVLEHVRERKKLISQLKQMLNKNGLLIIAVPQERIRGDCSIVQIIYNLFRLRFHNPHLVKIGYNNLDKLLTANDLKINNYTYTHFLYPFKTKKKRADSWSLVATCKNNYGN